MPILFVYGSLKRGCYNNPILIKGGAKFLGEIELRGYELCTTHCLYPYMVKSDNGGKVRGELWDVPEETYQLIRQMELGAGYKEVSMGSIIFYLYPREKLPANAKKIESGDWKESYFYS